MTSILLGRVSSPTGPRDRPQPLWSPKGGPPGRACRIRFLPMESRSTPTALTLAHGPNEADRANERDVAKPVARRQPRRRTNAIVHEMRGFRALRVSRRRGRNGHAEQEAGLHCRRSSITSTWVALSPGVTRGGVQLDQLAAATPAKQTSLRSTTYDNRWLT